MLCSVFRCRPLITFALRYYRASLRKKYDSNHTRKGFEKSLIDLSKTHKVLKITLSYKYLFTVYLWISIYLICDINYALFNHRLPLITSKLCICFVSSGEHENQKIVGHDIKLSRMSINLRTVLVESHPPAIFVFQYSRPY